MSLPKSIFVVGGNGFVGSSVCRAAVRRGWKIQSISKSGKPFKTPNGHMPAWTEKVEWHSASAFEPESYRGMLASTDAVVHTIGTLLEGGEYKQSIKSGNPAVAASTTLRSILDGLNGSNPLKAGDEGSYESINRDSAITVCRTFLDVNSTQKGQQLPPGSKDSVTPPKRAFVYLSAEDIFRPVIPARYITTKREAESIIQKLCSESIPSVRDVSMRPSFIYHPHLRPISSPVAALLDAAGSVHKLLGALSPVDMLSRLISSNGEPLTAQNNVNNTLSSIKRAVDIPPIHVDHVGEAVCEAIARDDITGPLTVWDMRRLLGWTDQSNDRTLEYRQASP